ncbi:hypothetical protein C8R41DRAFT_380096 [Lentinula lateritia]|uniref:Uncharacterized protein n=1 Tax=Lentinula lateritia TaxID=40482 RepID=A0ABQ8VE92_9AGAR|nr:hypothetical protein C8R41DRAFT_380096 [Lentinula lateritia]
MFSRSHLSTVHPTFSFVPYGGSALFFLSIHTIPLPPHHSTHSLHFAPYFALKQLRVLFNISPVSSDYSLLSAMETWRHGAARVHVLNEAQCVSHGMGWRWRWRWSCWRCSQELLRVRRQNRFPLEYRLPLQRYPIRPNQSNPIAYTPHSVAQYILPAPSSELRVESRCEVLDGWMWGRKGHRTSSGGSPFFFWISLRQKIIHPVPSLPIPPLPLSHRIPSSPCPRSSVLLTSS